MLSQVLSLVINLISKRVICLYLNVEYLGLQSLYSNFCDVLSFAYFGAGTAMLFSFYGPLARGDKERLAAIYRYYDGIYKKDLGSSGNRNCIDHICSILGKCQYQ